MKGNTMSKLFNSVSFLPFFQVPDMPQGTPGQSEEQSFQDVAVKANETGESEEDTSEELQAALAEADKEASNEASPGIGHNQPPATDQSEILNNKRKRAIERIADFRPSVLNSEALAKEFKETGAFVSEKAIELQVHGGTRMAVAVADFVTLANRRMLDTILSEIKVKDLTIPKDRDAKVFDVTSPESLGLITKAVMATYFKDESAAKTQEKGVLKKFGYSSVASFRSTLGNSIKPAILLMLGVAQIAYTKKTGKLSARQDVWSKDNIPDNVAKDELMECIAIKISRVWKTIILDSGQEGKPPIKNPNKSDSLCVLTPEFASTLYGDETGQFVATEDGDGWLKAPVDKRDRSDSKKNATDKVNGTSTGNLDDVTLLFSDRRSLDKDGNVLKDKDGKDKLKNGFTNSFDWKAAEKLCEAFEAMCERISKEFPKAEFPFDFQLALVGAINACQSKFKIDKEMELYAFVPEANKFLPVKEPSDEKIANAA
jgi:hypothetical protein